MLNSVVFLRPLPVRLAILIRRQRQEEGATMDERYVTHIVIQQSRSSSSYSERETAAASHLGVGAIRHLRALGLIEGEETGGELRYSEEEVIQLRRVRRLQHDLGVNLAGVEVILRLLKRVEILQQELEQERNQARGRVPATSENPVLARSPEENNAEGDHEG